MRCPDDGGELRQGGEGHWRCDTCRGDAVLREDLARAQPYAAGVLRPEEDGDSGAFARVRRCPRCDRPMRPERIGDQLAWLHRCDRCDLLWVEKLNVAVMERLAQRAAVTRAVAEMPAEGRRELARDLAGELADHGRLVRALKRARELLQILVGW